MKLVIYNKQNSQPVGQRNGERTLRFNRENGMIYISKSFAAELGIKDIDWKIQCKLPPKTKRFCPLVLK